MRTENREFTPDSLFSLKKFLLSERAIIKIVYNLELRLYIIKSGGKELYYTEVALAPYPDSRKLRIFS